MRRERRTGRGRHIKWQGKSEETGKHILIAVVLGTLHVHITSTDMFNFSYRGYTNSMTIQRSRNGVEDPVHGEHICPWDDFATCDDHATSFAISNDPRA